MGFLCEENLQEYIESHERAPDADGENYAIKMENLTVSWMGNDDIEKALVKAEEVRKSDALAKAAEDGV